MTVRRFYGLMAVIVVALGVATLMVIAAGDRTEPIPLSVEPASGDASVPTSSSLVLRFGRPVDAGALRAALVIAPDTPGTLSVERSIARFVPTGGWRPGTVYAVTIQSGLVDRSGRTLRRDVHHTFQTRQPQLVFSQPDEAVSDVLASRNLWVTTVDAESPARRISREPLGILFAAVAPDGERIAFSAPNPAAPNTSALWIVNVDGTGTTRLAGDSDGAILSLTWSPRSDLVAYERRAVLSARGDLGRPRLLAIRPDGGGGGLLYGKGDEAGSQPAWSPDGRRLLLADPTRGGRVILDPTGESVLVTGGGTDAGTWSPDGQFVAVADLVQERETTRSVIRVFGADGQPLVDLTRPGYSDTAPAWSPDGKRIAVVSHHQDGRSEIWLLDPNGGPGRLLDLPAAPPGAQLTPPIWTAGGAMLAFSRLVPQGEPESGTTEDRPLEWELWIVNGDGSGLRRLPVDGLAEGWAS